MNIKRLIMKENKVKEFESISVTKIPGADLQVLRDNNITITSLVRTKIKEEADKFRGKK